MTDDSARNWEHVKLDAARRGDRWTEGNMDIDGAGGFIDVMPPERLIVRTQDDRFRLDDKAGRAVRVSYMSRAAALETSRHA
jgi:hypothetical protein